MKRYEPRLKGDEWQVFDSHTKEALTPTADHGEFDDASALSTLLNDLEGIGRGPGGGEAGSAV